MKPLRNIHPRLGAMALACLAFVISGCSLNPGDIVTDAQSRGAGLRFTIDFDNALNLPAGANVNLNGTKIGSVTGVSLGSGHVNVGVKVKSGIRIPDKSTASIRQDTVLGDPYVAISSAKIQGIPLVDGGTIPIRQTASAPPLEDTLSVLSTFINGGSIQNAQDVIRMLNSSMPQFEQTKRVAQISAVDLRSLAGGTQSIDTMLGALSDTANTITPRLPRISLMLNPDGMHYWSQVSKIFSGIGIVLPSIGSVFEGGFWLMPLLTGVKGSIGTVRDGIDAIGSNEQLLHTFITDNFFPFIRKPQLNVVSATSPDGQQVTGTIVRVLRILGAIR